LCDSLDNLRRMEDAGAGAIVLHSLFEEQINAESRELDNALRRGSESYAEVMSYFPDPGDLSLGVDSYLELLRAASESLEIPVIASLNGVSSGGWTQIARQLEQAGAAALELNAYHIPTDPTLTCRRCGEAVRLPRPRGAFRDPHARWP
jgi:dihydroorotate dehydrogenase (fumarate)